MIRVKLYYFWHTVFYSTGLFQKRGKVSHPLFPPALRLPTSTNSQPSAARSFNFFSISFLETASSNAYSNFITPAAYAASPEFPAQAPSGEGTKKGTEVPPVYVVYARTAQTPKATARGRLCGCVAVKNYSSPSASGFSLLTMFTSNAPYSM